jgi:uncharacterized membrane protein YhaH (DUF805 family)
MFKSPFSFKGRIRRLEYGLSYLIYIFLYLIVVLAITQIEELGEILLLLLLPCIWFLIAQGAKRCHDLGHSGFYQFIPFYGLWMLFQEGDTKENEYGQNPKHRTEAEIAQSYSKESKDISPKYILFGTVILVGIIAFGGSKIISQFEDKPMITWSERELGWEDFQLVNSMEKDYVAMIHSNISCPKLITTDDSKVYAYMDPNESERLRDEHDYYNVLVHEQYHFNITEYCARLLRKDIVEKGLSGLSYATMKAMHLKHYRMLEKLQDQYDSISDHNADSRLQREWELRIDDLLRQTAYYKNEDIYSYYNFTKNRTSFYKHIYFTHFDEILMSYPVAEKDIIYGKTYEINYNGPKEKIVKFYKDGVLSNGGYFKTAITKIFDKGEGHIEVHYLNADESFNTDLDFSVRKTFVDENKNRRNQYFNEKNERINYDGVYETLWKYNSKDESLTSTYFDKQGNVIPNYEGIYHSKRLFDDKERTIRYENFDQRYRLKNDPDFIARYDLTYSDSHKKVSYDLYDETRKPAYHLTDYHLSYEYDERGNVSKVSSLDSEGNSTYDTNGASIYQYTHDLYDRETSEKRFNKNHEPIVANDDYFLKVKEFDSIGRVTLEAFYYPDYVLKYGDSMWGASKYVYEDSTSTKIYNLDAYNSVIGDDTNTAIIEKHYNDKKELIKEVYLDTLGLFAKTKDGVVSYRYKHNDVGKTIQTAAYDSLNNLIAFEADIAKIRWEYDSKGNKTKTTYFNTDNELAIATDSVTFNLFKYDENDFLIERLNYNRSMKPSETDGVFKSKIIPNKMGLDSIVLDYNTNGKLKSGICKTKYSYNKYGNGTKVEYFNSANQRIKNKLGSAATITIYNQRQKRIGYRYLDQNLRPTNNTDGVSIEDWELDELGHTVSYSYYDKNKKPVIGPDGYHKIAYEWAAMGETSKTSIYDENLDLIEDELGTAIYEYDLQPSGLYSEVKRFNKNEELAENTKGIAITKYYISINGLYYLHEELNASREIVNDSLED